MYDASTGRFISRDPIQDGYNWYAYCGNDPVSSIDPEGLEDRVGQGPGQAVNKSKGPIIVVGDVTGVGVVSISLPPGYETNPGKWDVDWVKDPDGWDHILPIYWTIPMLGDPNDPTVPAYPQKIPGFGKPFIELGGENTISNHWEVPWENNTDLPKYPGFPGKMGIPYRPPVSIEKEQAIKDGYIRPIKK
jgi:hypothetical protein